jgi:tartrate-resistant acid phosphatase type 5
MPPLPLLVAGLLAALCSCEGQVLGGGRNAGGAPDGNGGDQTRPSDVVRFVAMGDTGSGSAKQLAVAGAIDTLCAAEGCDFVVLLGDNLYPDGADGIHDPIWRERFERPYAAIDLPFHAILGNHDYGIHGDDFSRGINEVRYTGHSPRWQMPATHYTMRHGPVGFVAIDTNSILWDDLTGGDQRAWWPDALAEVGDAPWIVTLGHHPYRSNGKHGNAGTYDLGDDHRSDEGSGARVKAFFDERVCGQVDVYLAAHDHNRQWLDAPEACGGTELVVSGAGGSDYDLAESATPAHWQDDTTPGFFYVVATPDAFTGRFVDADGTTRFERTLGQSR